MGYQRISSWLDKVVGSSHMKKVMDWQSCRLLALQIIQKHFAQLQRYRNEKKLFFEFWRMLCTIDVSRDIVCVLEWTTGISKCAVLVSKSIVHMLKCIVTVSEFVICVMRCTDPAQDCTGRLLKLRIVLAAMHFLSWSRRREEASGWVVMSSGV